MAQSQRDNQALIWDLIRGSQHEEDALTGRHEEYLGDGFIEASATFAETPGNLWKCL